MFKRVVMFTNKDELESAHALFSRFDFATFMSIGQPSVSDLQVIWVQMNERKIRKLT